MSEFKKFTLLKENGTIATSETIFNTPMSELVWEKENKAYINKITYFDIVEANSTNTLYLCENPDYIALQSSNEIELLKSKAERIYQIIKE